MFATALSPKNVDAQDVGHIVLQSARPDSQPLTTQQFSASQATNFTMFPSVISSSLAPYGAGKQKLVLFTSCVLQPFGVVPNCDITIDWHSRSGSGGHVHNTNRPPGEFKAETGDVGGSIGPGSPGQVSGNSGSDGFLKVTYTAPESSGITDMTVRGVAVVFGIPFRFGPNRFTLGVRFGGLAGAGGAGLHINTQSNMHGSNNGHAASGMRDALQSMAANFAQLLTRQGVPDDQVPIITINALSLPQGGLFDFKVEWKPPHTAHRFGRHADVRIRNLTDTQRTALAEALTAAGATAPYTPESPRASNPTHWHLYVR